MLGAVVGGWTDGGPAGSAGTNRTDDGVRRISTSARTPGAIGLAYQAAELAMHALLMIVDGRDPWDDGVRYHRAQELLGFEPDDLHNLHTVRLQDFYANAAWVADENGRAWGPPLEVPAPDDCVRGVRFARLVVDAANGFATRT